jgi:hypothetical protein
MKQTAVEFIEEYLLLNYYDTMRYAGIDLSDVIEQAKEMEKDQIVKAYESLEHRHGENYYKETFKTETIVTEYRDGNIKVETFKSK